MDVPPWEEQAEVCKQLPLPEGVEHGDFTQHWRSDGPVQYPETDVPPCEEHSEVCMQLPPPEGVEHGAWVQQRMSDDPGQRPEVTVPEQQPAETLTQAPVYPFTEHVPW